MKWLVNVLYIQRPLKKTKISFYAITIMKILFTDLDDTLLNKESKISEYSKSVLRDFVDAGNILDYTVYRLENH